VLYLAIKYNADVIYTFLEIMSFIEKYLMWKDHFKTTYEEAGVKTFRKLDRLLNFKRSGLGNSSNY
jgi:hypothetical protein